MRHPSVAFLLASAVAVPVTFAQQPERQPPPPATSPQSSATEQTASPGQISANPDRYIGRKVQIRSAEIETVHGQQVFTLDEDRLAAGPDVTVIIPKIAAKAQVAEDARVDVKGTVKKFVATEIKRDYSWFSVTPEVEKELEGRPVVIAESVKNTRDGRELVSGAPAETGKRPATQPEQPQQKPAQPEPKRY